MIVTFVSAISVGITSKIKSEYLILITFFRSYAPFLNDLMCQCLCLQLPVIPSESSGQSQIIRKFKVPISNISPLEPDNLNPSLRLKLMI
ncbi:hypothetical protein NPIL_302881 [Nephila pilipes]|uniref:Uncharacterized protein n=1 Tax=Nephila pilipes TaxID=299642 RepID=A0A8X6MSV0_NEPPI|nr:hypothetical protein NPIL_302881 [Nephila pilipes]